MTEDATLISVARIRELHRYGLALFGHTEDGLKGTEKDLQAAIETAQQSAFYDALETGGPPNLLRSIAYMIRNLAVGHYFIDGNKRVAWLAGMEVLARTLDADISATWEEAASTIERLQTRNEDFDIADMAEWLGEHLCAGPRNVAPGESTEPPTSVEATKK